MSRVLERVARVFVEPEPRDAPAPASAALVAPERLVEGPCGRRDEPVETRPAVRWLAPAASTPPASVPSLPAVPQAGGGARPGTAAIAVLCPARDAALAGRAAALALIEAAGAPLAVVAEWRAEQGRHAAAPPPGRAARRRAQALAEAGHDAQARGRLVAVGLPHAEPDAAAEVRRLLTAPGEPLVVALGGPRGAELDDVLTALDLALVVRRADADAGIAEVAVSELERCGVAARRLTLTASPGAVLARAGIRLPAALRPPLLEALEGLERAHLRTSP